MRAATAKCVCLYKINIDITDFIGLIILRFFDLRSLHFLYTLKNELIGFINTFSSAKVIVIQPSSHSPLASCKASTKQMKPEKNRSVATEARAIPLSLLGDQSEVWREKTVRNSESASVRFLRAF